MSSTDVIAGSAALPNSTGEGWSRFAPNIRGEGTTARRAWQSSYVRRTVAFDVLCAALAAFAGYHLWFDWGAASGGRPPYWEVVLLPALWLPAMVVARTFEQRFL